MDSVSTDVSQEIGRGMRRSELEVAASGGLVGGSSASLFSGASQTVVDGLYLRARKLTVFNNELARQTAVHCPRVARMLVKVWSEMCEVVESAVSNYEHQVRLSQQFHAKFRRLSSHTETKLAKLTQDNQELQREVQSLKVDLGSKVSSTTALERELEVWKAEAYKLNKRMADEMHARLHGDEFAGYRSTDFLSNTLDSDMDKIESERAKQIRNVEKLNRIMRNTSLALMMKGANSSIEKSHRGTQTEDDTEADNRPPPPPVLPQKSGIHIPREFAKFLTIIPRKTRLTSVRNLRRVILQLFFEKALGDRVPDEATRPPQSMAEFVTEFMRTKYGLPALADSHISELLQSIRAFYDSDRRVRLFDLFVGAVAARDDDRPILGKKALQLVSTVLLRLVDCKEINLLVVQNGDPDTNVTINRQRAVDSLKQGFHFVSPALLDLMAVQVKTLDSSRAKSSHMLIGLEDFLCFVLECWVEEQLRWQNRIQIVFDKYSSVGPALVIEEDSAPVMHSPHHGSPVRVPKHHRPTFRKSAVSSSGLSSTDLPLAADAFSPNEGEGNPRVVGTNFLAGKGAELMPRPNVDQPRLGRHITLPNTRAAILSAMPGLDVAQVDAMFEKALKRLEQDTWDAKRKPWKSAVDPQTQRKYYYNTRTQQSLWFMPIMEREIATTLDYSSFFEMCFDNNLLLSTAHERDILDPQTKAAVLIQKVARGFVARRQTHMSGSISPVKRSSFAGFASSMGLSGGGRGSTRALLGGAGAGAGVTSGSGGTSPASSGDVAHARRSTSFM